MSIELIRDAADTEVFLAPLSTLAVVKNTVLTLQGNSATWTAITATSPFWQLKALAVETVTSAATEVKCILIREKGQTFKSDLANNSNASHNGQRMVMTDETKVNNTGTDNTSINAVFVQLAPSGATSDKKAIGFFAGGLGVSTNAT